ncbi:ISAzo13 family transposase [Nonomuraea sp. NPDC002799]
MGDGRDGSATLAVKFRLLFPHLDERQRRLLMGAEAQTRGHGGIEAVARAAGVNAGTVSRGLHELADGAPVLGRVRRVGGGRKPITQTAPLVRAALLALVEPDMRGDPDSPLRWTTKSTRHLAAELTRQGHRISADTVADLLRTEHFSLQGNARIREGKQHPDRDAQFRYINEQARSYRIGRDPVISVDTKKKELIGEFANTGREWRPAGAPTPVNVHDFPTDAVGSAIPYGVYDLAANAGWVSVGTDHDTAAFAVAAIRRWWQAMGQSTYPTAQRLLITADAGGSNGYRIRAWKAELASLATETGLEITVCHFPPGTSKWNSIEHRLFCHITLNWRGRPLTSHEVVVNTISATTTDTGLSVHAELDTGSYLTGVTISDTDLAALPLTRHHFHGDWNYTLAPRSDPETHTLIQRPPRRKPTTPKPLRTSAAGLDPCDPHLLAHPMLTGMPRADLTQLTTTLDGLRQGIHQAKEHQYHDRTGSALPTGRPPQLPFARRVLITVLHLRLRLSVKALAALIGTSRGTIYRALDEIRPLLSQHHMRIKSIDTQSISLTDLLTLAQTTTEPDQSS